MRRTLYSPLNRGAGDDPSEGNFWIQAQGAEELTVWKSEEVSAPAKARQGVSKAGLDLVFLRNSLTRWLEGREQGVWGESEGLWIPLTFALVK